VPQIVLIAPTAFKGTFGPRAVAEALASGVRRALPEAVVLNCHIADGGDGLLEAGLLPGALRERVRVAGPRGWPGGAAPGWIAARVVGLTGVATPLVGPEGAAQVFAPQKGATPAHVTHLAAGLERLAQMFTRSGRPELASLPGGGAAGGLGAGLVYFAKADLARGAEWVFERVGFDAALAKADLVLTGEGMFDRTSLVGKAAGEAMR